MSDGKQKVLSGLVQCLRLLSSSKVNERKKQVEILKVSLQKPELLDVLDKNSSLKSQNKQNVDKWSNITWARVFQCVREYINKEADRFKERESSSESVSNTVLANRNRDKKVCSDLFKVFVRIISSRGQHNLCEAILDHILAVLTNDFTLDSFGLDYTNVLLKEILVVPHMFVEISYKRFEGLIWLYCKLIKKPTWDRVLLTQVLYQIISAVFAQYDIKPQELFEFFTSIFSSLKTEKASTHHEYLIHGLVIVCENAGSSCRAQICNLGESVIGSFIQLWKTKPSDAIKEYMLEFLLMQLTMHHPRGATDEEYGAFVCNSRVWKDLLLQMYHLVMKELNDVCVNNKYSSSKELTLRPSFVACAVEVCHQVFQETNISIEITQATVAVEAASNVSKKRRLEVGFRTFLDTLQSAPVTAEIIPWLQLMSAILKKYPDIAPLEDVAQVLRLLIQTHLAYNQLEVKIWLLISCQSAVEAYCFLHEKNENHLDESDAMHSDWVRLWELCIKSVALMPQCHDAGHDLLATMIKYKLIFPRTEFYKLYSPGSNNKLSLASLRTLAIYMVKFCLPSSFALSPSKGFGLNQQEKDWFRHQILNWLVISENSQEMSNLVNQLLCDSFDVDDLQFLAVLMVSFCLQDCKSFISLFPAIQGKKPDLGKFPWIQELETELLHLTFDLPFDTKSEHEENCEIQENFSGKLLHSVWDKCVKALLNTSNELFDHLSQEQTLNPYALLKQADLISQILKNMYLHHIINEDDLYKSPLTKSLKNLINEATEILSGKEIRGVKGVSAEHKLKWMKNTIPVISDMMLPCALKPTKSNQEKKILAWIADLFPPDFTLILVDIISCETVAPATSPSKSGSSTSFSRLPSSQSVTSDDDSLDEMFDEVPTDFQRPPAKRRNRYSPPEATVKDDFVPSIEMEESNDSTDVRKDYVMNPDVLPEKEKVQIMCVELIGKFCCVLSAAREQNIEFLPSKIIKKILDAARNKRNTGLKKPEDVQLILRLLKSALMVPNMDSEDIDCILMTLKSVLNKYSKYQKVCVAAIDILRDLFPHIIKPECETPDNLSNRDHAMHLIQVLWKKESQQKCNHHVSFALTVALYNLIRHDMNAAWPLKKQSSSGDGPNECTKIIEDFTKLLASPHLRVRMFVATHLKYLFCDSSNNPVNNEYQKIFDSVCHIGVSSLNFESTSNSEEITDEKIGRMSSLLHFLSNVILLCPQFEKKIIFLMCRLIKDNGTPVAFVAKVLKKVSVFLGYNSLHCFMESHLLYLIHEWLESGNSIREFPCALLEFDFLEVFLSAHYTTVVPLVIYRLDMESVNFVAEQLDMEVKLLVQKCLPFILARIFSWYATNDKTEKASSCHHLIASIITNEVIMKTLADSLDDVVFCLLMMVEEVSETYDCGDNTSTSFESLGPHSILPSHFIATIQFLKSKTNYKDSFVSLLAQKADSLQSILLSLHEQLSKSHRPHEQRRVIGMYHILADLFLPEFHTGLGNCSLFVLRDFIYTILNFITEKSFISTNDILCKGSEKNVILCCELIYKLCQKLVPHYSKIIGDVLPFIVSRLIPFVKVPCLEQKVMHLLEFLVIESASYLGDYVAQLDPFPELPVFENLHRKQVQLTYKHAPCNLLQEIDHFLKSYKTTENGTLEGVKHLHKQLIAKKEDLQMILQNLQGAVLCYEDVKKSSVHQLICKLAHLCTPGNSLPEVQKIASRCLGEIGSASLSSTVLQTSTLPIEFSGVTFLQSDDLYEGYYLVLHLLSEYLKDSRVDVKAIASKVLKDLFKTKSAQIFLTSYRKNVQDDLFLYLFPFHFGLKKKRQTPCVHRKLKPDMIKNENLWSPEDYDHHSWIIKLVCSILESGTTDNEFFHELLPICEKESSFCGYLLPYLVHSILLRGDSSLNNILSNQISLFFCKLSKSLETVNATNHSSSPLKEISQAPVAGCKASVQVMLSVVHHIRTHKHPGNEDSNALKNNFWLDLDYLHVAQAAQYCSAHFTSLLYTELWCDSTSEKIKNLPKEEEHGLLPSSSDSSENSLNCSPLIAINSRNPERANLVYKMLLNAYSSIGNTDGVHGCGEIATDTNAALLNHYVTERKWDRLLGIYDMKNSSSGIFQALKECGLYHTLQDYATSRLLTVEEPSPEVIEAQCECAWKLSQWDVPVIENESNGFQEHLYKSLQCLKVQNKLELHKNLDICRSTECENLKNASLESARSILPVLSHLQMLTLVEDFASLPPDAGSLRAILDKWEKQSKIPYADFEFIEPVLWLKCILLHQQLDIHPHKVSVAKEFMKSLEHHAVVSRMENHLEAAARAVDLLRTTSLGNEDDSLRWHVQEAKILWTKGEHQPANRLLKYVLTFMEKRVQENSSLEHNYAEALILKGKWSEDTCSENSSTIMQEYLEKAVRVLENAEEPMERGTAMWDAYLALARYADRQYQSIVDERKSTTFQTKQELMENAKAEILRIKKISDISDDQKRTLFIMEKQQKIDEGEIKDMEKEQQQFLSKAISNYLKCLQGTDAHDLWIFRLTALWFHNLYSREVNSLINNNIKRLQTYKFLPLMYQLAARMGTNSQGQFSHTLSTLIRSIALDHPYHALPVILASNNADKDPSDVGKKSRRRSPVIPTDMLGKERTAAAKHLICQLQSSKLGPIVNGMSTLCDAYISLAYLPLGAIKKAAQDTGVLQIPEDQPIMKIRDMPKIPLITEEIQVDRSCEYKNIVGIQCFIPEFRLCGGLNEPKVIKCIGTDGRAREQLVKGRDDLRQDAVMQQVFSLVNSLLKRNSETKRRKLHIRTYKIVPASRRSGVIQWCEGTQVLSQYLVGQNGGAHKKYYPTFWSHKDCLTKMREIAACASIVRKRELFDIICKNYPPVFRYFFLENFPQPAAWFERRLFYTKSTAVNSVVGYILGLGDRHVNNILIDKSTAEVVHIDFGIAFEKGRILPTPETVPFRLTRDIVDGMGICGVEGVFKRCCEKTLEVMRSSQDVLLTILEVLLYDPLYDWTIPSSASVRQQEGLDSESESLSFGSGHRDEPQEVNKLAERALMRLQRKLHGNEENVSLSISGQVNFLIQKARDPDNLCRLYQGWQPYL